MSFKGIKKTLKYTQIYKGNINKVFPLLCPIRELEWLDGWECKIIYSKSGLIEKDCVFITPSENGMETVWQVTQYDKNDYYIEFLRVTPRTNVVRINIELVKINAKKTKAKITYQYTALNKRENKYIENYLKDKFNKSMLWWEKSLNYYLSTGKKLLKVANKGYT